MRSFAISGQEKSAIKVNRVKSKNNKNSTNIRVRNDLFIASYSSNSHAINDGHRISFIIISMIFCLTFTFSPQSFVVIFVRAHSKCSFYAAKYACYLVRGISN